MKAKKKTCSGCDEERYIWKNHKGDKYCQPCWNKWKFTNEKPIPKKRKRIAPRSEKKKAQDTVYSQLRVIYLTKNPMCQASLVGCTGQSTDVHHKKGRGEYYLLVDTWMSVCRTCHTWIELHPIEATEMGYRESKTN